ncbi:hypothetical protein BCU94_18285 [Shewanella sp. 10N.286.52.C2]|uniref:hypothetical protein n=1 Tax=Shewanella sp. 10N.286.52.C2 TaxID=1880838 RepID=UPI000C83284A|nr:hypothetical protein [Shewanella sp. 10N.286.52.C2]PMG28056.1 hypothetical protein BCU94_18285 [Shewanella sp. 10N.286.52.C2]
MLSDVKYPSAVIEQNTISAFSDYKLAKHLQNAKPYGIHQRLNGIDLRASVTMFEPASQASRWFKGCEAGAR